MHAVVTYHGSTACCCIGSRSTQEEQIWRSPHLRERDVGQDGKSNGDHRESGAGPLKYDENTHLAMREGAAILGDSGGRRRANRVIHGEERKPWVIMVKIRLERSGNESCQKLQQ
jgi:hypothetical protein